MYYPIARPMDSRQCQWCVTTAAAGPVPAALAAIDNLVYLDVSNNKLSGSLKPFADVLAANVNSTAMVYLDLSDNRLTGPIPAGLSSSAILDPNVVAEIAPG